jgi:hypothetical protein
MVGRAMTLRYDYKDTIDYIRTELDNEEFNLSEPGYYKIRIRIIKKGRQWIQYMQEDQDAYLSEYRQRYNEMWNTQKNFMYIYNKNKDTKPGVANDALRGYHQITNDMAALIDIIPYVAGSAILRSKDNDRLSSTENREEQTKAGTATTNTVF